MGDRERFWRGVLRRQVASGVSVRAFCRREGVSEPSFYSWRRRLEEEQEKPAFVPVTVVGGCSAWEIVSPGGWKVRTDRPDEDALRRVLGAVAALERESPSC